MTHQHVTPAAPIIMEIFEESNWDIWISAIRWHTRFKTQLYVNVPPYELHLPEPEPYRLRVRFDYEFPLLKPINDWKQFFSLT